MIKTFSRRAAHTQNFEKIIVFIYFMAVLHSRGDLSEEVSGLLLWQSLFVLNVVIQLSSARVLHHHHNPLSALKHWKHKISLTERSPWTHTHTEVVILSMWFTLIQTDDMWVHKRGTDLDFSLDVSSIQIIPQSLLSNRFNSHLKHTNRHIINKHTSEPNTYTCLLDLLKNTWKMQLIQTWINLFCHVLFSVSLFKKKELTTWNNLNKTEY